MSSRKNVESEGGVAFVDPKMKALSSLDGEIGWLAAFPYGLQHVLAMFVANLAPIAIIAAAAGLPEDLRATLIQNAMFIAGIGTFVQLFPVWRVGSGLPIVMGISFTFVSVACTIAATQGYGALVGAVIVGGLIEGVLGLFARWWRRIITPIVAAVVVTSIGFSLLGVGRPPSAAVPARKISAAPRTSSSAPSRFWRASRSRASPRALPSSFRCSSDSSWGIWWPFRWAKWTSPVSLRRSSSRCRGCCP